VAEVPSRRRNWGERGEGETEKDEVWYFFFNHLVLYIPNFSQTPSSFYQNRRVVLRKAMVTDSIIFIQYYWLLLSASLKVKDLKTSSVSFLNFANKHVFYCFDIALFYILWSSVSKEPKEASGGRKWHL
jgi:hypothetical protein